MPSNFAPTKSSCEEDLGSQSVQAWSDNAIFWDAQRGTDSDVFYNQLELPFLRRMIAPLESSHILEFCAGNGVFARFAAQQGATVDATDASEAMLKIASDRGNQGGKITYWQLDITKSEAMEALVARTARVRRSQNAIDLEPKQTMHSTESLLIV